MSIAQRDTLTTAPSSPGFFARSARRAVARLVNGITRGRLTIIDTQGVIEHGDPATGPGIAIRVRDQRFYTGALLGGSLGVAESYLDGHWDCDDVAGLIELLLVNYAALQDLDSWGARLAAPPARIAYSLQQNTRAGSKRNIAAHYDLSNEFFALWLDPTMTYSSGIFERADATLEQAQLAKLDRACRMLELDESDHLLEIGTGWGSMAIHAASRYGCRVTTTTISERQRELAARRIGEAGLDDRIELISTDYRELRGTYSKLVSIEMIEAVGRKYLDTFMAKVSDLLADDGLALIQAITIRDRFYNRASRRRDFLKKYIFPGSCLLSVSAITQSMTRSTDLALADLYEIGPDYARTLAIWRENFRERLDDVRALGFDERFIRMWDFYFSYCEGAFRARHCGDAQLLFAKPGARPAPRAVTRAPEPDA